ncbi:MAG: NAD(P)H-dependent oxidoreductase [Deltaproteobacteria bacterium]|nr:NAD(P)H-dependent oxidoreductase [Deltaproteobacteria bacterium]
MHTAPARTRPRRAPLEGDVLVLLAHPAIARSRVIRPIAGALAAMPGVTVHDLYDAWPDFVVDAGEEQARLVGHAALIWLHPVYWYSTPALLKEWQDEVLTYNWAYGPEGRALRGKHFGSVVSTGGPTEAYQPEGSNRFPLRELLRPTEATAHLCGLRYAPPFAVQGTYRLSDAAISAAAIDAARYVAMVRAGALDGDGFGPTDLANAAVAAASARAEGGAA